MKFQLYKSSLILLIVLAAFPVFSFAQIKDESKPDEKLAQQSEPLGEDERIPFMQKSETTISSEPSSGGLMLRTLGAMVLIVGLIFAGAWGLRKLGFGNTKSDADDSFDMAVLSTVSLGSGRTISTLRFGERILLVGSTPQSFTLLADETDNRSQVNVKPMSVAEMLAEDPETSFTEAFRKAEKNLESWNSEGEQV
jgi:flagellar biogenesis protein FliO